MAGSFIHYQGICFLLWVDAGIVLILFRETEHGRLSKVFGKSIENCNDTEGFTDLEIPMGDIFTLIFSNPTYKK